MRKLKDTDAADLERILADTGAFTGEEVAVARELLDIVLDDPDQEDYEVIVAEVDGRVVGYVLFGPVPLTVGTYDLYWIAVDRAAQGRGIGQLLLGHVEQEVSSRGGRMICLETSSQGGYQRTRSFYDRSGYREESRIRDFYRPGDDRITYIKRFSASEES